MLNACRVAFAPSVAEPERLAIATGDTRFLRLVVPVGVHCRVLSECSHQKVRVPESFRGGCSFGGALPAS